VKAQAIALYNYELSKTWLSVDAKMRGVAVKYLQEVREMCSDRTAAG
jgi:hypothetical protein